MGECTALSKKKQNVSPEILQKQWPIDTHTLYDEQDEQGSSGWNRLNIQEKDVEFEAGNLKLKTISLTRQIQRQYAENIISFSRKTSEEDDVPIVVDPTASWLSTHPEQANKYRGKRVAYHPTHGIVAAGAKLETVINKVKEKGYEGQVFYSAIPKF